jgi:hydrogenase maturation protease
MIVSAGICIRKGWQNIKKIDLQDNGKDAICMTEKKKSLVLGLGNTILSDDGVGIYVTREIQRMVHGSRIHFKEASLGGLELLELLAGYEQVILIDAIQTGKHPVGSLISFDMEELKGGSAMSRHHVPLPEAIALGRHLEMDLPADIRIYAIEVQDGMTFSESCTPEMAKHIPDLAKKIVKEVFGLNNLS